MKVGAGNKLIEFIKIAYDANQPVLLEGRHGIGKSQIMEQAAKLLKIDCVVLDLSIMENVDLSGLPQIVDGVVQYAKPAFLPTGGKGLLVLEEVNRAPRYMQAPCLQLLTARKLNSYTLPKGWLPCACINPVEEGYIAEEMDAALMSRFVSVQVVPNVQEWSQWASSGGIDDRVVAFVNATPDIFKSEQSNPRAWTYVSQMLKSCEKLKADEESLLASISGLVGTELSLAFVNYLQNDELPLKASDILERYHEKGMSETVVRWKKAGQMDMLRASLHSLQIFLQSASNRESIEADATQERNMEKFIKELPAELRRRAKTFLRKVKREAA